MALTEIEKQVGDMRVAVAELTVEQKTTNNNMLRLCDKLEKYSDHSEKRLARLEKDVGNRTADDPTAFMQIGSLQSFKKRAVWWASSGFTLVFTAIGGLITALLTGIFGGSKQ